MSNVNFIKAGTKFYTIILDGYPLRVTAGWQCFRIAGETLDPLLRLRCTTLVGSIKYVPKFLRYFWTILTIVIYKKVIFLSLAGVCKPLIGTSKLCPP